ncbi:YheC/YheD family protein [Paenibacillus sp. 2KB_20]|uniref:YheC/YheD family protein n=1 Tax=Paenibacillus TaxID=44249 RepID=UPI003D2B2C41
MTAVGKWYLHRFYSKDYEIRKYLPPTALFNEQTLRTFMEKYGAVYIKPDKEHMGKGILKAWKTDSGYAFVLLRGAVVKCASLDELYKEIKKRSLSQPYIIQKAIPLAQINGRPFDIRVMMMRNLQNRWQFFGLYSKVAGPKSIVTNISSSRGYVTLFEESMKQSLGYSKEKALRVKEQLIHLSNKICKRAGKMRYYQKIGNDFAIDNNGNVWIIEVNFTYPGYKGFSQLPNQKYYWDIKKMDNILRKGRLFEGKVRKE